MNEATLQEQLSAAADRLGVPGAAIGIHHTGHQHYAFHGVTNIEHPLPVDHATIFAIGSTGKTFTATAIMCLVDQGRIDLGAPVRKYVPELTLADPAVAEEVVVLHLLNHTAGWEGDVSVDTGEGDDALAKYVHTLADLPQNSPLGGAPSYNNAAVVLAGHVIERVTGIPYERALRRLVLEPLNLGYTFTSLNDIMTRRFAAGHQQREDDAITVVRPWSGPRSSVPAGTRIASTVGDQIAWARFHLGDGRAMNGARLLSETLLRQMKEQTSGRERSERYGIGWRLRDVAGVRLVEHGGDSSGQHSAFAMVPESEWAITILTNCGPNGQHLREELVRWALDAYLGIAEPPPEPLDLDAEQLSEYVGAYETGALRLQLTVDGNRLLITSTLQPEEVRQALEAGEEPEQGPPPFRLGMLDPERFVIVDGPYQGHESHFVRDDGGTIVGLHIGRLAPRVSDEIEVER